MLGRYSFFYKTLIPRELSLGIQTGLVMNVTRVVVSSPIPILVAKWMSFRPLQSPDVQTNQRLRYLSSRLTLLPEDLRNGNRASYRG